MSTIRGLGARARAAEQPEPEPERSITREEKRKERRKCMKYLIAPMIYGFSDHRRTIRSVEQ
jgi:hypothetical protein